MWHNSKLWNNSNKSKFDKGTVTNQNFIKEGIKRRWNSANSCYHSVQKLLSSCLLSKNVQIRIYKIIILPVVHGCKTWSLTLREKHRLRVFEKRVLVIFGPKKDKVMGSWRKIKNEKFITCTVS
jgi:hypothetical protein